MGRILGVKCTRVVQTSSAPMREAIAAGQRPVYEGKPHAGHPAHKPSPSLAAQPKRPPPEPSCRRSEVRRRKPLTSPQRSVPNTDSRLSARNADASCSRPGRTPPLPTAPLGIGGVITETSALIDRLSQVLHEKANVAASFLRATRMPLTWTCAPSGPRAPARPVLHKPAPTLAAADPYRDR
jgi:hypothetical protein